MPAILVSICKWLFLTVILPLIEKAIAGYYASKQKASSFKKKKEEIIKKVDDFENNPSSDTFSKLP